MFRLLRFFSITSLFAILSCGILLVMLYRHEASQAITRLGEHNNLALANTVFGAAGPQLVDYLRSVANEPPQRKSSLPGIPSALHGAIGNLMQDNAVVRIKIFNPVGTVVYSTTVSQRGDSRPEPEGSGVFQTAMAGRVANALNYRDSFNRFDGGTEEDNLMQTYIPVRDGRGGQIRGVFGIVTDANRQVVENERILFKMLMGAGIILGALYIGLFFFLRRANAFIESQRRTILERTATIEQLSAQMMGTEESHKKQIAYDLHEGLAQTLSAIKMSIESGLHGDKRHNEQASESVIPILRSTIQEVRTMATRLRPSSLDDLGLLPTVEWYCRELGTRFEGVRAVSSISFREGDIPAHLKIIIYRVIDFVSLSIATSDNHARINIALTRDGQSLVLSIEHEPSPGWKPAEMPSVSEAEERATLSGGSFYTGRNLSGGITVRSAWNVPWGWPRQATAAGDNDGNFAAGSRLTMKEAAFSSSRARSLA